MLGHFCNVSEQRVGDVRPPKSGTEDVNMFSKNKVAFVFWKFSYKHDYHPHFPQFPQSTQLNSSTHCLGPSCPWHFSSLKPIISNCVCVCTALRIKSGIWSLRSPHPTLWRGASGLYCLRTIGLGKDVTGWSNKTENCNISLKEWKN